MPAILIKKTGEEPGAASLAVTVPVEQVQQAEARATSAYQRRARLPGFRKGKAPAALVKKQFADDIRQQALEELIRESWKAALAQEALDPVADPHVHNLKWDVVAGGPVTFEFHVEVKPELTLERIGKFHLKLTVPKVTEEQVQAQLTALREQKAPWVPVTGEKPALKDMVQGTIATREGDAVKDPGPFQIVLGEGGAIPEVEEKIMGMLPGETLDATVRFPPDFPEEAKRGQTRAIRLTLQEVERQHLAELDDAFAREVGDFESLAALRKAVRDDLEKDAERDADARVRRDVIEQIVEANRVVAPRPLVERAVYVYAQAYGIPEDRLPEFTQEFRPVAEAQVRRDLILDWVVERHGLRATAAELDARLQEIAARSGKSAPELRASLEKAKRLRDLERGLTEEKCLRFLCRNPPWSQRDEEPDLPALHHRALQPGRAHVRHLQPAAPGPHRVPRHADQRRGLEHHHRPAAVSRRGQPGAGHLPLHQFARRAGVVGHGDLRYDAVPARPREHHLHGDGGLDGLVSARGRSQGQTLRPAPRPHHDAPALGRDPGHRGRHRNPGPADPVPAGQAQRAVRQAHRQGGGPDREGHGPGSLHVRRGSQGVRAN